MDGRQCVLDTWQCFQDPGRSLRFLAADTVAEHRLSPLSTSVTMSVLKTSVRAHGVVLVARKPPRTGKFLPGI